jgi:serine phosphatase RsbU (regulator of sigma subunit)
MSAFSAPTGPAVDVAVLQGEIEAIFGFRWSNAGHPPPVVIHRDGTVQSLTGNDLLLGVRRFAPRHTWTAPLPCGSTVLLHTDGLVEHPRRAADNGVAHLHRRLRTARRTRLEDLLEDAVAQIGADRTDDIAMLAVRLPADG